MWLSVLTHTIPRPPPGAGVALTSVELSVAGAAVGVCFGLNREPIFDIGLAVGETKGEAAGAGGACFRV